MSWCNTSGQTAEKQHPQLGTAFLKARGLQRDFCRHYEWTATTPDRRRIVGLPNQEQEPVWALGLSDDSVDYFHL